MSESLTGKLSSLISCGSVETEIDKLLQDASPGDIIAAAEQTMRKDAQTKVTLQDAELKEKDKTIEKLYGLCRALAERVKQSDAPPQHSPMRGMLSISEFLHNVKIYLMQHSAADLAKIQLFLYYTLPAEVHEEIKFLGCSPPSFQTTNTNNFYDQSQNLPNATTNQITHNG